MYVSKVSKGLSFNGQTISISEGQKTANIELVNLYPDFFEKFEEEKVDVPAPVVVETIAPVITEVASEVIEEKVDLTDEIQALADTVEVKEVKENKKGFKLFK